MNYKSEILVYDPEGNFTWSKCGNGIIERNETCDDNNSLNDDGCDQYCVHECGNGKMDRGEECDDGNVMGDDGCDEICLNECGNNQVDGSEECDF